MAEREPDIAPKAAQLMRETWEAKLESEGWRRLGDVSELEETLDRCCDDIARLVGENNDLRWRTAELEGLLGACANAMGLVFTTLHPRIAAALDEGGLSEPERHLGRTTPVHLSGSESDADVQGGRGTHGAEDTASKPGSNPVPPRHSLAAQDEGGGE